LGRTWRTDITTDMGSISTSVAPLDGHLRSKDGFDTANHPTARFKARRLRFDGHSLGEVTGSPTLRGKTLPFFVSLPQPLWRRLRAVLRRRPRAAAGAGGGATAMVPPPRAGFGPA